MKELSESEKRNGFRVHAFVYVMTILLLMVINLWTGPPYWVMWVVPGWSVGLLAHWFFFLGPGFSRGDAR